MTDKWKSPEDHRIDNCDHGVVFDEAEYTAKIPHMSAKEVRERWPRLFGVCPKNCGFEGIGYASFTHYLAGDW